MATKEISIIVTGFGLFDGLQRNASCVAVRLLPTHHHVGHIRCNINCLIIPVEYAEIDRAVADIWNQNPDVYNK